MQLIEEIQFSEVLLLYEDDDEYGDEVQLLEAEDVDEVLVIEVLCELLHNDI